MSQKLLTSAVFAGVAAGLIAALLQFVFVIPALLEGELFETGARIHFGADGSPESDRGAPGLGGEWGRHLMTVGFNIVTYVGFGFLLLAAMAFAELRGLTQITARQGLIWGLAGFIAIQLAPAIGLPPELPGTPAAEIGPRQAWWLGTLVASTLGLWIIAFGKGFISVGGVVLLLIPQLIGAPHLEAYYGVSPPELSAEFATLSLGTAAAGWATLGFLCAWFWTRPEG